MLLKKFQQNKNKMLSEINKENKRNEEKMTIDLLFLIFLMRSSSMQIMIRFKGLSFLFDAICQFRSRNIKDYQSVLLIHF